MIEEVVSWIVSVVETTGYAGIFVLMALEGSFLPVPSEVILPFSGFLASRGEFSLWLIALTGAAGNIVGTLATYAVSRYFGLPFLYRYGKYFLVTRRDIEQARLLFAKYGVFIIFMSRLLPGIRGFLPIPAGVARMPLAPFVSYVFVGSFIWSLFLASLGFLVGENWDTIGIYVQESGAVLLGLAAGGLLWFLWRRISALKRQP